MLPVPVAVLCNGGCGAVDSHPLIRMDVHKLCRKLLLFAVCTSLHHVFLWQGHILQGHLSHNQNCFGQMKVCSGQAPSIDRCRLCFEHSPFLGRLQNAEFSSDSPGCAQAPLLPLQSPRDRFRGILALPNQRLLGEVSQHTDPGTRYLYNAWPESWECHALRSSRISGENPSFTHRP